VSKFEHPPGGAPLALADPLAPDLAAVLARLGADAAVLARLAETAA
jgi:hypothetical protein